MVMIGTDSHKRTHTVVAIDDVGRRLGERTLRTNTDGHLQLLAWSEQFEDVVFALEDCRHLTRPLEGDLLRAGQKVVRVPTRLMAGARRGARTPGKSDPIDAEAVALAALRPPDLPVAELEGPAREVKLLSDHRRDLVMQRTRACCQLRWHLHELDPDLVVPTRSLRQANTRERIEVFLGTQGGTVARLAGKLVTRIADLSEEITGLEKELKALVLDQAPRLAVAARVRGAVRRGDHRRDRRDPPVPRQGRLRQVHRHRARSRLVWGLGWQGPPQPRRQPADELRPAYDRPHPSPRSWTRPGLPGQARIARQGPHRSPQELAPAPIRHRLPGAAR